MYDQLVPATEVINSIHMWHFLYDQICFDHSEVLNIHDVMSDHIYPRGKL